MPVELAEVLLLLLRVPPRMLCDGARLLLSRGAASNELKSIKVGRGGIPAARPLSRAWQAWLGSFPAPLSETDQARKNPRGQGPPPPPCSNASIHGSWRIRPAAVGPILPSMGRARYLDQGIGSQLNRPAPTMPCPVLLHLEGPAVSRRGCTLARVLVTSCALLLHHCAS